MEKEKKFTLNWSCKEEEKEYTASINNYLIKIQRVVAEIWWFGIYSPKHELLFSSYSNGEWCEDLASAKSVAEKSYLYLLSPKEIPMEICVNCNHEFTLPQGRKRDKLFHSENDGINQYQCEGCWTERVYSEDRYVGGIKICLTQKCGRDANENTDFCAICINERAFV